MRITRHSYTKRGEETDDFMVGLVGWFICNVIVGSAVYFGPIFLTPIMVAGETDPQRIAAAQNIVNLIAIELGYLSLVLNIGLMIYFGFTRYWIALGMLAGFTLIGVGILLIQAAFDVVCSAISRGIIGH